MESATDYSPLATRYSLLAPRSTHLHPYKWLAPSFGRQVAGGLLPLLGGKSPLAECGTPAQPTEHTPRPHGHSSAFKPVWCILADLLSNLAHDVGVAI